MHIIMHSTMLCILFKVFAKYNYNVINFLNFIQNDPMFLLFMIVGNILTHVFYTLVFTQDAIIYVLGIIKRNGKIIGFKFTCKWHEVGEVNYDKYIYKLITIAKGPNVAYFITNVFQTNFNEAKQFLEEKVVVVEQKLDLFKKKKGSKKKYN